jgi:hypothetical protein
MSKRKDLKAMWGIGSTGCSNLCGFGKDAKRQHKIFICKPQVVHIPDLSLNMAATIWPIGISGSSIRNSVPWNLGTGDIRAKRVSACA